MALNRAIIRGDRIQAVGFRESIADALRKMGVLGTARNIRDRQEVWLEIRSDKPFSRQDLQHAINLVHGKNPLVKGEIAEFEGCEDKITEKRILAMGMFQVVREDDLHEMVWALQGAGTLFSHATEKVTELLDIKKTEKGMRLNSLRIELAQAQNALLKDHDRQRELICMRDFISSPMIKVPDQLLEELMNFYYEYGEYRNSAKEDRMKRKGPMLQRIDKMLQQLKTMNQESLNTETQKTGGEKDGQP